jgi:hypothetical protein
MNVIICCIEIQRIYKHSLSKAQNCICSPTFKALCYKPEGRGFETRMKFFNLPNPSGRDRPWGLLSLYQK